MQYFDFHGKKLSRLGFGTMRLPLGENGQIDENKCAEMFDFAIKNGVNYFDTAFPYHSGLSEIVTGKILGRCPRDSYYLADKFPGHQICADHEPSRVFETQLKKCSVDYFDFYLLHNVYEGSIEVYEDEKWGIIPYFLEQKRLGRIKHLGFSTHGGADFLRSFLDKYGSDMEFCQIQMNYMDYTLEEGREKLEMLGERGIPVWIMEPLRGGKLAALSDEDTALLKAERPDESTASWAMRYLMSFENIGVILSGMSAPEQVRDNVKTFSSGEVIKDNEIALLYKIADGMKNSIPCTACRYCVGECPMGLDIPTLLAMYNDVRFHPSFNVGMRIDAMPEDKRPTACLGCGACAKMCPQKIDIPAYLAEFSETLDKMPKWADICRQREEEAKKREEEEKNK